MEVKGSLLLACSLKADEINSGVGGMPIDSPLHFGLALTNLVEAYMLMAIILLVMIAFLFPKI